MTLSPKRKEAFTLIELLVVIAIIVIIAAISIPMIPSLVKSGQINQTVNEVSATLESARQYAVAQNTYVWVTFVSPDPSVANQVDLAVIASADGTEVTPWGGSTPVSSFVMVSKVRTFPLTYLASQGTVLNTSAATNSASITINNLGSSSFSIPIPGRAASVIFGQALEFTPSGEARVVTGTPTSLIEFDMQAYQGPGVLNTKNGVVFQINGLTGVTRVYRQ